MKISKLGISLAAIIATLSLVGLSQAELPEDQELTKVKPKFTQGQAEATAQKSYPQGKIKETELEKEESGLVYSVEFTDDAEVEVDANTGKVIKVEEPGQADENDDD